MSEKYLLTDESILIDYLDENGKVAQVELYRIVAAKDFSLKVDGSLIKEGELGGWVESYNNLSQEGSCFVCDEAKVFGEAKITEDGLVSGFATVYGKASVSGEALVDQKAKVYGEAKIKDQASVFNEAEVYGKAILSNRSQVQDKSKVYESAHLIGEATIKDYAEISGNAVVSGNAIVTKHAALSGDIFIGNESCIEKDSDFITIGSLPGLPGYILKAYKTKNGATVSLMDYSGDINGLLDYLSVNTKVMDIYDESYVEVVSFLKKYLNN